MKVSNKFNFTENIAMKTTIVPPGEAFETQSRGWGIHSIAHRCRFRKERLNPQYNRYEVIGACLWRHHGYGKQRAIGSISSAPARHVQLTRKATVAGVLPDPHGATPLLTRYVALTICCSFCTRQSQNWISAYYFVFENSSIRILTWRHGSWDIRRVFSVPLRFRILLQRRS